MIEWFLYFVLGLIPTIYVYIKYKYSFWKRHGVPYLEPKFPFGNVQGIGRKLHSSQLMTQYYREMKGRGTFVGIYFFINPSALITNVDLAKNILIKDFSTFQDRGVYFNERDDPLSANLLTLEGQKWKSLRSRLTPTFTSGKMKFMFPTIVAVGDQFQKTLREVVATESEVEIKDILARFTTDVIGTCAFGIDCNSLKDPNGEFRRYGKKVFEMPRNLAIKQVFMITFRSLARILHMKQTHDDVSEFFLKVVRETVEYREKNNIIRNDFMNLLIELKNTGKISGESTDDLGTLSIEEITAQAYLFFLAGFETSSTTISYCLYELSQNQEIQDRARQEIESVLEKHGGEFTYEAYKDMTYVGQIINESLRRHPPGANLIRKATKDYPVPGTDKVIPKGTTVWIPVYAIHNDEEFYPEPNKFDPERFSPEAVHNRKSCTFMPFGEGPRNCIGLRFGMMQTQVGLVTLLKNFRFTLSPKTPVPLVYSTKNIVLSPAGGLWLNIEPL